MSDDKSTAKEKLADEKEQAKEAEAHALDEIKLQLGRAKDAYLLALKSIDRSLKAAVSVNPKVLKDAHAVQKSYLDLEAEPLELKALEQPVDKSPKPSK